MPVITGKKTSMVHSRAWTLVAGSHDLDIGTHWDDLDIQDLMASWIVGTFRELHVGWLRFHHWFLFKRKNGLLLLYKMSIHKKWKIFFCGGGDHQKDLIWCFVLLKTNCHGLLAMQDGRDHGQRWAQAVGNGENISNSGGCSVDSRTLEVLNDNWQSQWIWEVVTLRPWDSWDSLRLSFEKCHDVYFEWVLEILWDPTCFSSGNSKIFIFTPKIGEDEPNLTRIFFRWVGSTTN